LGLFKLLKQILNDVGGNLPKERAIITLDSALFAEPLRFLERHRSPGRLLRRPATPPPVPGREPAHQPRAAHHGHALKRRLSDVVYRHVLRDTQRTAAGREDNRGDSAIQRG
jgi:hypothetical protein